jgi:diguanylate cyclase (GGDEF)-like protein
VTREAGRSSLKEIEDLKADAERFLLSAYEVDQRLLQIASAASDTGLGGRVTVWEARHSWGADGEESSPEEVDASRNINLSLINKATLGTNLSADRQRQNLDLLGALTAVWANRLRDKDGGLTFGNAEVKAKFADSIRRVGRTHDTTAFACVYFDLDHLKAVNSSLGEAVGDRALRHVCASIHHLTRRCGGLAFRDGGDEFVLVLPTKRRIDVLRELWDLRTQVRQEAFGEQQLRFTMAIGVTWRQIDEVCAEFGSIRSSAEHLTKNRASGKRRDSINLESGLERDEIERHSPSMSDYLRLGLHLSRARAFNPEPFADERLNFLGERARSSFESANSPSEHDVQEWCRWLNLDVVESRDERPLLAHVTAGGRIPQASIALALLHGVAMAEVGLAAAAGRTHCCEDLRFAWSDNAERVALYKGESLLWGPQGQHSNQLTYGRRAAWLGPANQPLSAAVGIQIGFSGNDPVSPGGLPLPHDLFLALVRVDSRPYTGGGLPDFWQMALAETLSALGRGPAGSEVIIWGDSVESTETYKRLSAAVWWSVEEMSRVAGLSIEVARTIAATLPQRMRVVNGAVQLVEYLANPSIQNELARPANAASAQPTYPRIRRPMATADPVGQEEAVVCSTAALAYPIVIDTLRKSDLVRQPRDDSDQELRELLAFKLKLTDPSRDSVPAYLSDAKSDLDAYVLNNLLSKQGRIRSRLEESGQVDAFVRHLVHYVGRDCKYRSTRRASMVVPNSIVDGELQPLGLISVWATPRFPTDGRRLFDFVFVWRTVEAFIGLPYSLYGSIQLAKELVSRVATETGDDHARLSVGELTYVALSLHLGNDPIHNRVAKAIVDSASD